MTESERLLLQQLAVIDAKLDQVIKNDADHEIRLRKLEAGHNVMHLLAAAIGAVLYHLFTLVTSRGGN